MAGSRYPAFDVTQHADAWDDHTRSIVLRRLKPSAAPSHLSGDEAEILENAVRHLLGESREQLTAFVVAHFDQKLGAKIGEAQRKTTVPPFADLLRQGLAAIDALGSARHGRGFAECSPPEQRTILADLASGNAESIPELAGLPQKELFQQLLSTAVEAYASHPVLWSEIGYAGPAYPRGYYRIERGLTDPWEPKAERRGAIDAGDEQTAE